MPCPPALCPTRLSAGKQVFGEALAAGTVNNFFKLIEQFRTQVGDASFLGQAGGRGWQVAPCSTPPRSTRHAASCLPTLPRCRSPLQQLGTTHVLYCCRTAAG